jgi:hypothetical protein
MTDRTSEPEYLDSNGRPIKERQSGKLSESTVKKIADVVHIMLKDRK